MWKLLADFAKKIAFLTQDTQKNKTDIAEIQKQIQALTEEMREMQHDIRRDRENSAHEHEKLLLRLEVALLRYERRTLTGRKRQPFAGGRHGSDDAGTVAR